MKVAFWWHLRKISPFRESIYCEFHYVVLLFLFLIPWDNMKIDHEDFTSEIRSSKARTMCKTPYVCLLTLLWKKKKKNRRGERKKERKEEKGKNSTAASHP